MSDQILIEVCVDSVASAIAAERGGARRVELCSNLLEGGVTPSAGLIESVRARTTLGLQVMIRPRGGDFCYTADELDTMRRDIVAAKKLGAEGVVVGILDTSGNIDTERTRELVELARPLNVTFHRAFDMAADLFRALEDACATGADRLLTSGGEQTALQGVQLIARLAKAARGRIVIMAGAGIDDDNVVTIIEQTGINEIHVGLGSSVASPMLYRNSRVSMGAATGREYRHFQVLEEDVVSLRHAIALAQSGSDSLKGKR
jgi:copper homeostasis protein